jgi:rhamnosyltransferase
MASSAIRRSVWDAMPFDESIQYSEDIDWTWRARQKGYEIRYVPDAIVMHSHNYTGRQFYRRHYGEGRADAVIFDWSRWERSFVRYSLLPFIRQIISDERYCLYHHFWGACLSAPLLRLAQLLGKHAGFRDGLKRGAR